MKSQAHFEFQTVTLLTVEQATEFYKALARFPTNGEISAIRVYGMDLVIQILQRNAQLPASVVLDFQKLDDANTRAKNTIKQFLKKLFPFLR